MRIAVRLAREDAGTPVPRAEIAKEEELSADYIEQIMMKLKAAGLVSSRRGARGGFFLARDPARITVEEILLATEGQLELAPCDVRPCVHAAECSTRPLWREAADSLARVFRKTTLKSLLKQHADRAGAAAYVI